ncbi:MAG: outer membrane beta-barrel protein [Kofleriaceae bacterium]
MKILIGATLLCAASIASAQDAPDPAAPPPDGTADGTTPPTTTTTTAPAGGAMWGDEIISRPLTMPKSKVGVYGDLDIARFSVTVGTVTDSSTSEGLHLGFGYGVDDKLTVGAEYAFALHDFEIKGPLTLYGSYSLYHAGKLTIGGSADLLIDFNGAGSVNVMTGAVSSSTDLALQAGLGVRYMLTDKVAVYTGSPIAPGPLGQHLSIGLNNSGPITFDIPVGVALQATPQVYAYLQTDVARLGISNSSNAFLFADFIPLDLGVYYTASKALDVGAFLNLPDLKNAKFDVLEFGIAARYYM